MANVTIAGATYSDVPAIQVPSGSGTASFYETKDVTYNLTGGASASVTPSEAVAGQGFSVKLKAPTGYVLSGVTVTMGGNDITSQVFTPDEAGGGGGAPSATQHTIYFEFSDSTNTTINAWYDDAFISNAITATTPTTYGGKTVTLAQLDGVTWYSHDTPWETLYDGIPDFYTDAGNYFWIASLANVHPTVGSEWRLTIDGTVYYSTAKQSGANVVIGNPINCGGTNDGSNVPVAFYNYNGTGWAGDTLTFTTGGHSVKIERKIS